MDRTRYEQALLDPADIYDAPADVLADDTFSTAEKIEILRRWEYDAAEIGVADEEGMPNPTGAMVHDILVALGSLGADLDLGHTPPTKQGGLDRRSIKTAGES
ncbi:hypothetical protein ACEWPM_013820 [Roseovarius sp. S4756]|uniref:hypothetical protein n=1 Tax=Roseovarius maritimus TaxID=3342637 RepID=UPI00372636CC